MEKVQWIASLSNGETLHEGKGNFEEINGELSPWQKLLKYLEERDVEITSLSLGTNSGKRWNIPSAGKNPKFKEFADVAKPIGYRFFRKIGMDTSGANAGKEDLFTCIEAQYSNGVRLQVWVDDESHVSWSALI